MDNTSAPERLTVPEIIARAGGYVAVAQALGIARTTPYSWQEVPAIHVLRLAQLAGLEPRDIRPGMVP